MSVHTIEERFAVLENLHDGFVLTDFPTEITIKK